MPSLDTSQEEWFWAVAWARLILGTAPPGPEEALAQILEENTQETTEVTQIVAVEPLVEEDREHVETLEYDNSLRVPD